MSNSLIFILSFNHLIITLIILTYLHTVFEIFVINFYFDAPWPSVIFYPCLYIHPVLGFLLITYVPLKQIIPNLFAKSRTINDRPYSNLDLTTFFVLELFPVYFSWKLMHLCPLDIFFHLFSIFIIICNTILSKLIVTNNFMSLEFIINLKW